MVPSTVISWLICAMDGIGGMPSATVSWYGMLSNTPLTAHSVPLLPACMPYGFHFMSTSALNIGTVRAPPSRSKMIAWLWRDDGIGSAALLIRGIQMCGATAAVAIPPRPYLRKLRLRVDMVFVSLVA